MLRRIWSYISNPATIGLLITIFALVLQVLQSKKDAKYAEERYLEIKAILEAQTESIKNYFEHPDERSKEKVMAAVETSEFSLTSICEQLKKSNTPIGTRFVKTPHEKSDSINAKKYEAQGFEFLLSKDIDCAIVAFIKSENSSNGYKQVYEIALFLMRNKEKLSDKNSGYWNETYKTIRSNYNWKMSPYYKGKFDEIIK